MMDAFRWVYLGCFRAGRGPGGAGRLCGAFEVEATMGVFRRREFRLLTRGTGSDVEKSLGKFGVGG